MSSETQDKITISGGEALARMLQAHDVGPIFGMGGFQLLPFYEASRVLGLQHFLINDERCGAFAADAYARVTGKPGVCDATLGPGATNLVTALVESYNAGVPIIALAGNTNRAYSWRNMTQETRQSDILAPAVKEIIRIEVGERIPEHVRRAYRVATSGRPGPVLLDVPEDIAHGEFTFSASEFEPVKQSSSAPSLRCRPERSALLEAAAMLNGAKRPVMLIGGGIHQSLAYVALSEFAGKLKIPVAYTLSGKGAMADTDPLCVGLFGRYSRIANDLLEDADCVLVVGCKLGEIATKRYSVPSLDVPLIHIDNVAEEIGRWRTPKVGIWADAREALVDLIEAVEEPKDKRKAYFDEIGMRRAKWYHSASERLNSDETPINVGRLLNELTKAMPADSILVADGGFAAHWGGLLYDTKASGRTFLADRGFASIGYGVPGGLGAALAVKGTDTAVVALTGDGGFNMVMGEMETACRLGANFVLVVINNAASGYVKALQHAVYNGQYQSSDLSEIDYAEIAKHLGCASMRVETPDELPKALETALKHKGGPFLLDVQVTRDPAKMLPAADNRTLVVKKGDRPV